jgi:hypothetical protein
LMGALGVGQPVELSRPQPQRLCIALGCV